MSEPPKIWYSHIDGVGWVPKCPRSHRNHNKRAELEDRECLEAPASSKSTFRGPADSQYGAWCADRRPNSMPPSGGLDGRAGSTSRTWRERPIKPDTASPKRSRDKGTYSSNQGRSRSGSPGARRDRSAARTSPRSSILSTSGDPTDQGQTSSPSETPPYFHIGPCAPPACRCGIIDDCICTPAERSDCRPYVPEAGRRLATEGRQSVLIERPARVFTINEQRVISKLKVFPNVSERIQQPNAHTTILHRQLEEWIHDVQLIAFQIDQDVLTQSRVLGALEEFLSADKQNFRNARITPAVEEDITFLSRKWSAGNLDNHPDRGLNMRRNKNGKTFLVMNKQWGHYKDGKYYGAGNLVTGQRWPGPVHMARDGGHTAMQAGICGHKQHGAYAVVMGLHDDVIREYYADRDQGDLVRYVGTKSKTKATTAEDLEFSHEDEEDKDDKENETDKKTGPSIHTSYLLRSIESQNPIRLFRSHRLPTYNPYRPTQGFRYDGLYKALRYEIIDIDRHIYRFDLERLPGQPPIRLHDQRTFEQTPEQRDKAQTQKYKAKERYKRMKIEMR